MTRRARHTSVVNPIVMTALSLAGLLAVSIVSCLLVQKVNDGTSQIFRFHPTTTSLYEHGWTHIVLVMESSKVTVYKNGTYFSSMYTDDDGGGFYSATPATSFRTMNYFGKSTYTKNGNTFLNGTMSYFRMWEGTALTSDQAQSLYISKLVTPARTASAPWTYGNMTYSGGAITKTGGKSDAYDALAITNTPSTFISCTATAQSYIRICLMGASDSYGCESGAMLGMWPPTAGIGTELGVYTLCAGTNAQYIGTYAAGDKFELAALNGADIGYYHNGIMIRTCSGQYNSNLRAGVWIYSRGSSLDDVHPRNETVAPSAIPTPVPTGKSGETKSVSLGNIATVSLWVTSAVGLAMLLAPSEEEKNE
mmetsp:Transcript_19600/g.44472  ORF Transcript_19600/g.44472 Transcript_19600/m.44472 type:complete len:365 (+) Transcript_19600:409-1503(+)